jgi:hypothetical protein
MELTNDDARYAARKMRELMALVARMLESLAEEVRRG